MRVILIIILALVHHLVFGQARDTTLITKDTVRAARDSIDILIAKALHKENNYDSYTIILVNYSQTPLCVLHSTRIPLFFPDYPRKLVLLRTENNVNFYSLHYTTQDTLAVWESSNPNYDAEVILPYRELRFEVLIPPSHNEMRMEFEYFPLYDFCYASFEKEIFKNAATWYDKYPKRKTIDVVIPK